MRHRHGNIMHQLAHFGRIPPGVMPVDVHEMAASFRRMIFFALLAVPIGALVGLVDAIFGIGLHLLNLLRMDYPLYFIPFLGPAGLLLMFIYDRYGGKAKRGMGLIFAVGYEEDDHIPLRMVPLTIGATWLTHLFGGSAGREGVAVQIGATISMAFARFLPKGEHQRILLLAGMAAGFAGLFGTPMAGTFFALEVLVVGSIFYEALVPALTAAWVAAFVSKSLGLQAMFMPMIMVPSLTPRYLVTTIAAGVLFGIVGKLFAYLLVYLKFSFANLIHDPIIRIGLLGCVLSVLFLLFDMGRYSGLSDPLLLAAFSNGTVYPWDWILKLLLTVLTLAAGFQGGELAPCFVIGASLGYVLGDAFGMPTQLMAACGCAAVFGSATNTLLAPIFVGVEIFGPQALPFFFIVCVSSYVVTDQGGIYAGQKQLPKLMGHSLKPYLHRDALETNKKELDHE